MTTDPKNKGLSQYLQTVGRAKCTLKGRLLALPCLYVPHLGLSIRHVLKVADQTFDKQMKAKTGMLRLVPNRRRFSSQLGKCWNDRAQALGGAKKYAYLVSTMATIFATQAYSMLGTEL